MANIPGKNAVAPELQAALDYIEQFLWETGDVKMSARVGDHGRWVACDGRSAAPWPELNQILLKSGSPFGTSGSDAKLPPPEARAIVKTGTGGGLQTRALGATFGTEPSNMPSHNHGGATGTDSPDHAHGPAGGASQFYGNNSGTLFSVGATVPLGGFAATGGASVRHTHAIGLDGSGSTTDGNVPPSIALNMFIHT